MSTDPAIYYKHSGRYTPVAAVGTLGVSALVAVILGAIYGVIVHYQPFIYFNALGAIGLGYLLGKTVCWIAKAFKARSTPLVLAVSLITGIFAYYGACISWVTAISEWQVIIVDPNILLEVLREVAALGAWSIGSINFTGWGLYSVWLIEAAIFIGMAAMISYNWISDAVFC